ncbi:MAG: hypothetical protein COB23_07135 [Methylophaga sp.]|nr:MAG: hypothetical protein COB23_07135 [Methylophaga sp.]
MDKKAVIAQAYKQAKKSGDVEAQQKYAKALVSLQNTNGSLTVSEPEQAPVISSAMSSDMKSRSMQFGKPKVDVPFMARMGRGMMDIGQGVKQNYLNATDPEAGEQYTKEVTEEVNRYEYDQGEGFDTARVLGQIAPTLPAMMATLPASLPWAMGVGAVEGGVIAGNMFTKEGDSKATQIALGVAGGAAAPAVVKGVTHGVTRAVDTFKRNIMDLPKRKGLVANALDNINVPAKYRKNISAPAMQQLKTNGVIDEASLLRMSEAQELGFTGNKAPMTGQVTRNPKLWTQERNLQKVDGVGDEITGRLLNQNRQFTDIFDDLAKQSGRSVDDVIDSGQSIVTAVNNRFASTQKAVGKLYERAQRQYGNIDGITLDSFSAKLSELSDDASVDKIANSVARRLQRYGVFDAEGVPTGQTLTINQAEGLRKFVNNLSDGNERSLARVKGLIIDELDNDVFSAIGDDAYAGARQAAKARFSEFEQSIVAKITNGKMNADSAIKNIVKSHSLNDLKALRGTLEQAEGGKQAWANLRGEVIEMLNMASTQRQGTDGTFSGAAYNKALNSIGRKKLEVLFPNDVEKLYKLGRVGRDLTYQPPFSSVNHSNSAPTLRNYVGSGAKGVPILKDMVKLWGDNKTAGKALEGLPVDPTVRADLLRKMNERIMSSIPMKYTNRAAPIVGSLLANQN